MKAALVQVRSACTWRSKWFRTSPFELRVKGSWIVCYWLRLAPESDESTFESCFHEVLGYADVLFKRAPSSDQG